MVIEEADERAYWIELLIDSGFVKQNKLRDLLGEAREWTAIFNAARTTARKK